MWFSQISGNFRTIKLDTSQEDGNLYDRITRKYQ